MTANPQAQLRSALLICLVVLAAGAQPAVRASAPEPVTITTDIVFTPAPPHGTFSSSGPVCESGEFVDELVAAGGGPVTYAPTVRKHFICDDGSGTYTIQFHPQFNPGNPPTYDESGPWAVVNGTGAYIHLRGHGHFGVVIDPAIPGGTESFLGFMSLD